MVQDREIHSTDPSPSRLQNAIDGYRGLFGYAPGTWGLEGIGRDDELAALIEAAIQAGEPFDSEATAKAWGVAFRRRSADGLGPRGCCAGQGDSMSKPPPAPLNDSRLDMAIAAHHARFGFVPSIWNLRGQRRRNELAGLIEAAIQAGVPFDVDAMRKALERARRGHALVRLANQHPAEIAPALSALWEGGTTTSYGMAKTLHDRGLRGPGGGQWTATLKPVRTSQPNAIKDCSSVASAPATVVVSGPPFLNAGRGVCGGCGWDQVII
jgi:hypothetical protein